MIIESSKNFINPTLTIATRQQMRMASVYYQVFYGTKICCLKHIVQGMFETLPYNLPDKVYNKADLKKNLSKWPQAQSALLSTDEICEEISSNGTQYKKGDLIVKRIITGGFKILVGHIKLILVRDSEVIFLCFECIAEKHDLGYYRGKFDDFSSMSLVKCSELADVKPLIMRGTSDAFIFVLHHFISHEFE